MGVCSRERFRQRDPHEDTPKQRACCVHELRRGMDERSQHRGRGVSQTSEGNRLDQVRCDFGLCSKTSGKTLERCEQMGDVIGVWSKHVG